MPVSSWVNSVEFIDAVISGSNNSVSYNLSKGQNYANCVPFYTVYSSSNYYDNRLTDVTFSGTTNSGIIRFDRSNNRSTSNYVKCYVVEFNPQQVRVQQGSFTLNSTTTQTITLPTTVSGTDRTAMTFSWKSDNGNQHLYHTAVRGRVVNTTSIDFYRWGSSSTCTGHWFLFEDLGNNFRTYHVSGTHNGGQTISLSDQKTVDPLRTFVLGSYAADSANEGYANYWSARIFLYSTGTVRSDKNSTNYNVYWASQIIEIQDKTKIYVPMDQALNGWTTPNTYVRNVAGVPGRIPLVCNPQTSSMVVAMAQGLSRGEVADGAGLSNFMVAAELTASGTITNTKGGTSYATYPSYTVAVDWAGIPVNTGSNLSPIPKGNGPDQSFVKSVENFRFTLSGNLGAYVLTKGQVTANCAIFSSSRSTDYDILAAIMVNVFLVEPGIVCMQHWDDVNQAIVDVSVVEFYPDQVRVQQFNINTYSNSVSTFNVPISTISSVNKAFILFSVFTPYWGYIAGIRQSFFRIRFIDTSNIELYKYTTGYEVVCSIFVVEDLQNNFVTAHTNRSFATNDSFYDETQHWGSHNSFPIVSYAGDTAQDYPYYGAIRSLYMSEFRPIYCDKASGSYNIYWVGTIVKFLDEKKHTLTLNKTVSASSTAITDYYNIELRGTENITAYNVCQYGTIYCNTSDSAGTSDAFGTITIKNYNTGEYEISKGGSNYTGIFGGHIINWPGYHYQATNNITGTRTKSFINSIQRDSFVTDAGTIQVWLRFNQDITKCVPFICNSAASSDGYQSRLLKAIYRYSDPDCFRIRFSGNSTATRKLLPYIVEFNQDIKVQYGNGYTSGTSKTFTIDTVNLNRAFLQFYVCSDSWQTQGASSSVCGYFSSSTQLTFVRNSAVGCIYISWYVVECPEWGADSYWTAYHGTTGFLYGTTVYNWLTTQPAVDRSIFSTSYAVNEAQGYPYYGYYRIFHRQDHGIQMDRQSGSYDMIASNVEVMEFSQALVGKGLKVYSNFYTLYDSTLDIDLKLNSYDNFHIQRSMLINENNENISRVDTSDFTAFQQGYHYLEFKDTTGSGYSTSITASKTGSGYNSYGFYNAIQFPKYNKYYFSGYVKELDVPVVRKVAAYKASSGELTDTAMSISGTGYFYLETTDYEPHYIVAVDKDGDFSYNDLIYGKVYPTAISGAFAWVADYPTVSGIGEYVT